MSTKVDFIYTVGAHRMGLVSIPDGFYASPKILIDALNENVPDFLTGMLKFSLREDVHIKVDMPVDTSKFVSAKVDMSTGLSKLIGFNTNKTMVQAKVPCGGWIASSISNPLPLHFQGHLDFSPLSPLFPLYGLETNFSSLLSCTI